MIIGAHNRAWLLRLIVAHATVARTHHLLHSTALHGVLGRASHIEREDTGMAPGVVTVEVYRMEVKGENGAPLASGHGERAHSIAV